MVVVNNKGKYVMPQTLEDGTEVYSKEEVDTQMEERLAEEREKLAIEKDSEMLAKDEELSSTKEALEKLQKKEMNFENLRKKNTITPEQEAEAVENAEKMKNLEATVSTITETLTQVQKQPLEAAKAEFKSNNIGADKNLDEKFEYFYEKLGKDAKTVAEVNEAITAAFLSATGGSKQPNFTGRIAHTSVNDNFAGMEEGKVETEASQEFGALLGLKPEDKKIHGGSVKTSSVPIMAQTPIKEK